VNFLPTRPCLHFSVEMETRTGKTYVYLRTIYELAERYGWLKFIIVVPSVATQSFDECRILHSLVLIIEGRRRMEV
jgi:restriction endonuclease